MKDKLKYINIQKVQEDCVIVAQNLLGLFMFRRHKEKYRVKIELKDKSIHLYREKIRAKYIGRYYLYRV